jgi:hypothetical protein
MFERDDLGHAPAEREAEEVDLVMAEPADEGDGVGGHLVDRVRHRSARRADPAIVNGDHVAPGGDPIDDAGVPVVQDSGQVVQEHERHAAAWPELAVGELHATGLDRAGRRVLPRRVGRTLGRVGH